ncbi:hypothetical protein D3C75_617920 [compost metagenome]
MYQQRRAQPVQNPDRFNGLLRRVVGYSNIERFAGTHGMIKRSHCLFQRCVRVRAVRIKDVDIVQSQPLQALIQTGQHIFS